jgi:hypothetical protein
MRPLFHAVRDETLVSLLPDESSETIVRIAIDAAVDSLPFQSEIIISPAGLPKISGSKPSWTGLRSIVEQCVPSGKVRRLLSVKVSDFTNRERELRDLATAADCPFAPTDKLSVGQTFPIIRPVDASSAEFPAAVEACLVSLAIGVEEVTKNKAYGRKGREDVITAEFSGDLPGWFFEVDPLTRRTALSLMVVQRGSVDSEFKSRIARTVGEWFAEDAVFEDMKDKASVARDAVRPGSNYWRPAKPSK